MPSSPFQNPSACRSRRPCKNPNYSAQTRHVLPSDSAFRRSEARLLTQRQVLRRRALPTPGSAPSLLLASSPLPSLTTTGCPSTPAQLRTSGMRRKRVVDNLPLLDSGIYSTSLPSLAKLYSPASQPYIHGATFLSGPHTFRYVRLRVPLDSASAPTRTQRQGRDVWRHCKKY
ncbi:hypothetical protein ARMGADRAFT_674149 [Armillaria gallica]|uniref:Uncharacterized protein n=1 Tax=Armillaria gallica TaxID=47427 RepID=A0A2H3CKK0_ARMGA|nr:hypothetical protein ARMGADRAFT_674149 [Armillaria gallica]